MDDLYADFGFFSDKEANENGVEVGNVVLITGETVFLENPDLVVEKSMDNRAGVRFRIYCKRIRRLRSRGWFILSWHCAGRSRHHRG